MPSSTSHESAIVATVTGAIVSIASIFGVVVPQNVSTAIVTLVLFAVALGAHLLSRKASAAVVVAPVAVPVAATTATVAPPAKPPGDGAQRG